MSRNEVFKDFFLGENSIDINFKYIEDNIPEFNRLKGCQQPTRWHMEGDAYAHTMNCIDAAYELLEHNIEYKYRAESTKRLLLLAVLFHDIGKPDTTFEKDGVWHSYGHDITGEKIVRRIFWNENVKYRELLCSLVRWHMEAYFLLKKGKPIENLINATFNVKFDLLMFVHLCDIKGSISEYEIDTLEPLANHELMTNITSQFNIYSNPLSFTNHFRFYEKDAGRKFFYYNVNPYSMNNKDKKPTVYVMIGLPGSGKDTYIKDSLSMFTTVCRDDIRAELGFCKEGEKVICTDAQEKKVSEVFNERLVETIKSGKSVVINNINLKKKYREGYYKLVKEYNPIIKYIYVEAPSIEDNYKRREGQISKEVFDKMISSFEWPSADEPYDTFDIAKEKYNEDGTICYMMSKFNV